MAQFILQPLPTFEALVALKGRDGVEQTLSLTCRAKTAREFNRLANSIGDDVVEFLGQLIADWSGPIDPEGKPVPYTVDALDVLLWQCPGAFSTVVEAYKLALLDAQQKN